MAQNTMTVTPPNPTPPTNMSFTGVTGPNPTNYTKNTYTNPVANPPPYFDDGAAGASVLNAVTAFAAQTAALAGGTGVTSGGTENSYPGTDTAPFDTPNRIGAVPASTSVGAEGTGIETALTQSYAAGVLVPGDASTYTVAQTPAWAAGDPGGKLRMAGVSPALTPGTMPQPNMTHASTLSPAALPTVTTFVPATNTVVSGAGTMSLQVNGTGFTPQTVIWVNGAPVVTNYVSSVRVDCTGVPKRPTAGTYPVIAVNGGVVQSTSVNYQWT